MSAVDEELYNYVQDQIAELNGLIPMLQANALNAKAVARLAADKLDQARQEVMKYDAWIKENYGTE